MNTFVKIAVRNMINWFAAAPPASNWPARSAAASVGTKLFRLSVPIAAHGNSESRAEKLNPLKQKFHKSVYPFSLLLAGLVQRIAKTNPEERVY
jgi:hypothetical protein